MLASSVESIALFGDASRSLFEVMDPFIWGVWASLSPANYRQFLSVLSERHRSGTGAFFGCWSLIFGIPVDDRLKIGYVWGTKWRSSDSIELEPTAHPLAREQSAGIDERRVVQIFEAMTHPPDTTGL